MEKYSVVNVYCSMHITCYSPPTKGIWGENVKMSRHATTAKKKKNFSVQHIFQVHIKVCTLVFPPLNYVCLQSNKEMLIKLGQPILICRLCITNCPNMDFKPCILASLAWTSTLSYCKCLNIFGSLLLVTKRKIIIFFVHRQQLHVWLCLPLRCTKLPLYLAALNCKKKNR